MKFEHLEGNLHETHRGTGEEIAMRAKPSWKSRGLRKKEIRFELIPCFVLFFGEK